MTTDVARPVRTNPPTSDDLRRRARDLFPGGVNSPVRAYRAVGGEPPIIVRGSGSRVLDVDGREYIDLLPPSPHEAWFLSLAHTDSDVAAIVAAAREAFTA